MASPDVKIDMQVGVGSTCQEVISEIWQQNPSIRNLTFVQYFYEPQTLKRDKVHRDISVKLSQPISYAEWIKSAMANLPPGYNLGVFSRVKLDDGSTAHIALMDSNLPVDPESPDVIKERTRKITGEQTGFILQSDKSYHCFSR